MGVFISKPQQKPIQDQTIVITGGSSGIGLATAKMAVDRGACVVLAARSETQLKEICEELNKERDCARYIVCDVSKKEDLQSVVNLAKEAFGGFDTWVNNAGLSLYGNELQTDIKDERQVFDVNFWGTVYGSKIALSHLKKRGGGSIVNMGSLASMRAFPLQGAYCATKHAVKAFTEVFRMEIEYANDPISVSLILPSSTATPFAEHAKSDMDHEPKLVDPIYDPYIVAHAILECATKPHRRIPIGGQSFIPVTLLEKIAPGLLDRFMVQKLFNKQQGAWRGHGQKGSLFQPTQMIESEARVYGDYTPSEIRNRSMLTSMSLNSSFALSMVFSLIIGAAALAYWPKLPKKLAQAS